jgi:hypothetical protein
MSLLAYQVSVFAVQCFVLGLTFALNRSIRTYIGELRALNSPARHPNDQG